LIDLRTSGDDVDCGLFPWFCLCEKVYFLVEVLIVMIMLKTIVHHRTTSLLPLACARMLLILPVFLLFKTEQLIATAHAHASPARRTRTRLHLLLSHFRYGGGLHDQGYAQAYARAAQRAPVVIVRCVGLSSHLLSPILLS
jgi:hypothetical protein